MKLADLLKKQQSRGLKSDGIKAKMQSYEDYVEDDVSPRPYNTESVKDIDITARVIKDTKSAATDKFIRDTKSVGADKPIRDTKSVGTDKPIRDTKSVDADKSIRDTKSVGADKPIRDTKNAAIDKPIRDTKSSDAERSIMGRPPKAEIYNYADLTGNSKKLVDEIARICIVSGSCESPPINKDNLSANTGVKASAIKTTIIRLKHRGVIVDYRATKGRHSSWAFILSESIFKQFKNKQIER